MEKSSTTIKIINIAKSFLEKIYFDRIIYRFDTNENRDNPWRLRDFVATRGRV